MRVAATRSPAVNALLSATSPAPTPAQDALACYSTNCAPRHPVLHRVVPARRVRFGVSVPRARRCNQLPLLRTAFCAFAMDIRPPRPAGGARASSKPIPIRRHRSMGTGLKEEEDAGGRGTSGARPRVGRPRAGAHRAYGYGRGRRHHGARATHAVDDDVTMGMSGLGATGGGGMLSQSLPPRAPIVHSLPNPGMMDHMPTLSLPPPSPDATSYFVRGTARAASAAAWVLSLSLPVRGVRVL